MWTQLYTGNGTGTDQAFNLKSDGCFIYVTGPTVTAVHPWIPLPWGLIDTQVFLQKYTMGGTLVWEKVYGGAKTEYARGLEVDNNYIYISASTKSYVDSGNNGMDNTLLWTINKHSGNLVSQKIWGGLGIDNVNSSIDQDEHGGLYLSGYSTTKDDGTAGPKRAVVMKVNKSDLIPSCKMKPEERPLGIYPNPFSSETTIQTGESLDGATLTVFNANGQACQTIGPTLPAIPLRSDGAICLPDPTSFGSHGGSAKLHLEKL